MRTVGRWITGFALFWWDFVVGDDWRVAAVVVTAIGATALLVDHGVQAWWLVPVAVLIALCLSLRRAVRGAREADAPEGHP